jgi:hypothetical protein
MPSIQLTDLAATWERCAITIQDQALEPTLPFTPYNVFDFYFPAGRASARHQRSLHYEFLSVDASNREAVVDFCERFGVLRIVDEGKESNIMDALTEESDPQELARYPSWSVGGARLARYGDTPASPGGYRTLAFAEFQEAQAQLRRTVTWAQTWQQARSRDEAYTARFNLRQLINPKLRVVYPRLAWDEQQARWVTGWDIRSLEAAMYLMLLLDLQGPGTIRICPWDQIVFLGDERTRYCSLRCQNAHNVQQFRQTVQTHARKPPQKAKRGGEQKRKPTRSGSRKK